MKLPNSEFVGCEEEEVATALGSVCHVVQLISKYLGVCFLFIDAISSASKYGNYFCIGSSEVSYDADVFSLTY